MTALCNGTDSRSRTPPSSKCTHCGIFSSFSKFFETCQNIKRSSHRSKNWQNLNESKIIFNKVDTIPVRKSTLLKIILNSMRFCQFFERWLERFMFWHVSKNLEKLEKIPQYVHLEEGGVLDLESVPLHSATFCAFCQMGAKATFQGCVIQERKIASSRPGRTAQSAQFNPYLFSPK